MRNLVIYLILGILILPGCKPEPVEELPRNDYKVHAYYVVPTDKSYSDDNANRVGWGIVTMRRWLQSAMGGVTFELLDEENVIDVYFAEKSTYNYREDWYTLLLDEMQEAGEPVRSPGTITMIWVEGITQVSESEISVAKSECDGECGAAILPIHTVISITWPPSDLGTAIHDLGHTLGLEHPVEEADLPLAASDQDMLWSVMCPSTVRMGAANNEYGFLTTEKQSLFNNPFIKQDINIYQDFWSTRIINLPITGSVPDPEISHYQLSSRSASFNTNIEDALLYYWYFSDGSTSNLKNPTHEFEYPGLYSITLMVTTPEFMSARVSQYVQIN